MRRDRRQTTKKRQSHSEPNYVVELLEHHLVTYDRHQIVMSDLKHFPDNFTIHGSGVLGSSFEYNEWHKVLETLVYLWILLLHGKLWFTPKLVQNVLVSSDTEELHSRLRVLFEERVLGLVEKWHPKRQLLEKELGRFDMMPSKMAVTSLIVRKIGVFTSGMECVLDHLKLGGKFDWRKIYWMIKRKCMKFQPGR